MHQVSYNYQGKKVKELIKMNIIREEIGWIDFNHMKQVRNEHQIDFNSLFKEIFKNYRENPLTYFLYLNISENSSTFKYSI